MKHTNFELSENQPLTPEDPRLTAWVLGELPADEAATVAAAVAADPELAAAVTDLRALKADLGSAFAGELATAATTATVATAAAAAKAAGAQAAPATAWPWVMPLAASFLLVGLIGSALWWQGGLGTRVTEDVTWLPAVGTSAPTATVEPAAKVEPAPAIEPAAAIESANESYGEARTRQSFLRWGDRRTFAESARQSPPLAPAEWAGQDVYDPTLTDGFRPTAVERFTTIGLDADTASWNVVRRALRQGQVVPRNAVRVEELVNAFPTSDPGPAADSPHPVAVTVGAMPSPWAPERVLVRVAVKAREVPTMLAPRLNLVFLVDVSGSMSPDDRLPLVKEGLLGLASQLGPRDRLAIVTYAGTSGVTLEPVAGDQQERIRAAIQSLRAAGGTAGGEGLRRAYDLARRHFDPEGINRIVLCTDGDFNIGNNDRSSLAEQVQAGAREGIYLNAFGFGMGNLHDGRLRELARHGQGAYGYISDRAEAEHAFIHQSRALLLPVAREVKAQVEFNPAVVAAWRIFGHDDRRLAREDFLDDKKDGGGEGRTLTQVLPKAAVRAPASPDLSFTAAVVGFALHLRHDEGLKAFGWPALRRLAVAGLGPEADARRVALLEAIGHAERLNR